MKNDNNTKSRMNHKTEIRHLSYKGSETLEVQTQVFAIDHWSIANAMSGDFELYLTKEEWACVT